MKALKIEGISGQNFLVISSHFTFTVKSVMAHKSHYCNTLKKHVLIHPEGRARATPIFRNYFLQDEC